MRKYTWHITTLLLAAIGILIGLYGLKSRSPMYAVSGMNLASSSITKYGNLELRFDGKPVRQATVTYICLWNAGRETIRRDDIAPADPIRLVTEGNILSCRVARSSRKVINSSVDQTMKNPSVRFDFLDHNDWILLQVLHTGSKPEACGMAGTVMGCNGGFRSVGKKNIVISSGLAVGLFVFICWVISTLLFRWLHAHKADDKLNIPLTFARRILRSDFAAEFVIVPSLGLYFLLLYTWSHLNPDIAKAVLPK